MVVQVGPHVSPWCQNWHSKMVSRFSRWDRDPISKTAAAEWRLYDTMIWGWVKTLVPSEPQNSWDLWMFIPLKMVFS